MTDLLHVVASARACLGTPFHHQGRVAGIGLDCIGLVIHAFRAAGLVIDDQVDYGRRPDGKRLEVALHRHGFVQVEDRRAGDVLLFRFNRAPQHVALAIGEGAMIHAYAPVGRVVEAGLSESWQHRLCAIYRTA
jgi:NlpC/P60 family putative phage cell wall peptidase